MSVLLKKKDLAEVTGINARTLLDWTQKGYLEPEMKSVGQGKTSYYSPTNAVQALILKTISDLKIPLKKFKDIFSFSPEGKPISYNLDPFQPMLENKLPGLIIINDCERVEYTSCDIFKDGHAVLEGGPVSNWQPKKLVSIYRKGKYNTLIVINLKEILLQVRENIEKEA